MKTQKTYLKKKTYSLEILLQHREIYQIYTSVRVQNTFFKSKLFLYIHKGVILIKVLKVQG